MAHTAERGQQCYQAASVEIVGCSFWMVGPAAEAEFQYSGRSERIQRQGQPFDGEFE